MTIMEMGPAASGETFIIPTTENPACRYTGRIYETPRKHESIHALKAMEVRTALDLGRIDSKQAALAADALALCAAAISADNHTREFPEYPSVSNRPNRSDSEPRTHNGIRESRTAYWGDNDAA